MTSRPPLGYPPRRRDETRTAYRERVGLPLMAGPVATPKRDRMRLTLEVDRPVHVELMKLVALMHATTMVEAIRRSVSIMLTLYKARREGRAVVLTKHGERDQEVILP